MSEDDLDKRLNHAGRNRAMTSKEAEAPQKEKLGAEESFYFLELYFAENGRSSTTSIRIPKKLKPEDVKRFGDYVFRDMGLNSNNGCWLVFVRDFDRNLKELKHS